MEPEKIIEQENTPQKERKLRKTRAIAVIKSKPIKKSETTVSINPDLMIMTAIEKGMTIDMLKEFLDLRERVKNEQAKAAFNEAMTAFQAECPVIPKTKVVMNKKEKGGGERYRFAPMDVISRIAQPFISKNGFSHTTRTEIIKEPFLGIRATITISHVAGYSKEFSFEAPMDPGAYMTEPQKWLSAATFASRIVFCNGFGIKTGNDDNDANFENPDDPEAQKKKAEEEARKKEANEAAIKQLSEFLNLNPNIKKGLEALSYKTEKAQWIFCNSLKWNSEMIQKRLNFIADSQEKKS